MSKSELPSGINCFYESESNYCDKGGHRERSLYHSPNHAKHWKKEEKKRQEFFWQLARILKESDENQD